MTTDDARGAGAAVEATGSDAELAWIPDERLLEPGVEAAGLRCRPVADTVADVWAWLRDGGEEELDEWRSEHRPRPMSAVREQELLALQS